jgi:spore coat polysaccharide biosynthesis predicted glycosyltransferase SpsG
LDGVGEDVGVRAFRDPADICAVFDQAIAAVSSAGTGAWELFCLGVPTGVVDVSPTQAEAARQAAAARAALYLGTPRTVLEELPEAIKKLADAAARRSLSSSALEFIDGNGAARTVETMLGPWSSG